MRLQGKVAIVTGGGMGMGRAITLRLVKEGAKVAIFDVNRPAGEETAHMVHDLGGEAEFIKCDISKPDDVRQAVTAQTMRFGKLHILVNNVGVMHPEDDLLENSPDAAWEYTMGVNLKGPFHCCKYAIPELIACGGGSIVTTSSNAGINGTPRPIYGTSKAGVISLVLSIARQYAKDNIRANVILPGAFNTPMLATVKKYPITTAHPGYRPLNRIADPSEIAGAVAFLASDDSSYITGSIFPVDGGGTAV